LRMALYILDILHLFSPIFPETLEGKYDYPYDTGEGFQAQRVYHSLKFSKVVSGEPSTCLYTSLGSHLFSELNCRPQTPIS